MGMTGALPVWIVVVIVMWVLASPLLGVAMILFPGRRRGAAAAFERGEHRLVRRAAVPPRAVSRVRAGCERRARRRRIPHAGA